MNKDDLSRECARVGLLYEEHRPTLGYLICQVREPQYRFPPVQVTVQHGDDADAARYRLWVRAQEALAALHTQSHQELP